MRNLSSCWSRESKVFSIQYRLLLYRMWREEAIPEVITYFGHMTWRNGAGTDLEVASLRTSFHSIWGYGENCQGIKRKVITLLQILQTHQWPNLKRYNQWYNSPTFLLGVASSYLIGLEAHSRQKKNVSSTINLILYSWLAVSSAYR